MKVWVSESGENAATLSRWCSPTCDVALSRRPGQILLPAYPCCGFETHARWICLCVKVQDKGDAVLLFTTTSRSYKGVEIQD